MANEQHLNMLEQGSEAWNLWRQKHPDIQPDFRTAHLEGANLSGMHLEKVNFSGAHLERANLNGAHLEEANLSGAYLPGANLGGSYLQKANLSYSSLEKTNLSEAHLEGTNLRDAHLEGANLQLTSFDNTTRLNGVSLGDDEHGFAIFVDVSWGNVNLAVVDWTTVEVLGDEQKAHSTKWVEDYRAAVRANRQLAVALRSQGLNEEADQFAYRAHLLQKVVWRKQRKLLKYIFSWFLYLLAGYGYRPLRSVAAYLVSIFGFMGFYLLNSMNSSTSLTWDEALVLSLSSFHGRGFFNPGITLGDTFARIAVAEAVIGLIIEISFIATFTQRFFGR